MGVRFAFRSGDDDQNAESQFADPRFQDSLEAFFPQQAKDIVWTLQTIQTAALTWPQFVEQYGWKAHNLAGPDTYPGAHELHSFYFGLPTGEPIEVVAYRVDDVLVVTVVARPPTRRPAG